MVDGSTSKGIDDHTKVLKTTQIIPPSCSITGNFSSSSCKCPNDEVPKGFLEMLVQVEK